MDLCYFRFVYYCCDFFQAEDYLLTLRGLDRDKKYIR